MTKKLVIFMPSIEGGGVEKNLFIISNYLSNKLDNIILVTASKEYKKKFKNIKIISPRINLKSSGRKLKYIFCLFELLKIFIKNRRISVLSFQANLYCIILSKIFNNKIIVRSNSSPSGWSKNFIKRKLFRIILNFADTIIVNSQDFKKEFKNMFNLQTIKIYNPLNKNEIIKLSKKKIRFPFFEKEKEFKIINIGRFTDQKDHITLLKSIYEIKSKINVKLLIIGRGINLSKMREFIKKKI
ncbi:glycosyltransferase, family 1 [alpha proteobacterium HIMB5]|nr:glycosyltransferase, family 1 [alpha proteobacterium HIMB5]